MEETHIIGQLTSSHSTISSLLSALSPAASLDYSAAGQKGGGWRVGKRAERDGETEGRGVRRDGGMDASIKRERESVDKHFHGRKTET